MPENEREKSELMKELIGCKIVDTVYFPPEEEAAEQFRLVLDCPKGKPSVIDFSPYYNEKEKRSKIRFIVDIFG